jgi:hypothetical protein
MVKELQTPVTVRDVTAQNRRFARQTTHSMVWTGRKMRKNTSRQTCRGHRLAKNIENKQTQFVKYADSQRSAERAALLRELQNKYRLSQVLTQ